MRREINPSSARARSAIASPFDSRAAAAAARWCSCARLLGGWDGSFGAAHEGADAVRRERAAAHDDAVVGERPSTAFASAAIGPIAPPSPRPFTPRGLSGETTSTCAVRNSGISAAVGSR